MPRPRMHAMVVRSYLKRERCAHMSNAPQASPASSPELCRHKHPSLAHPLLRMYSSKARLPPPPLWWAVLASSSLHTTRITGTRHFELSATDVWKDSPARAQPAARPTSLLRCMPTAKQRHPWSNQASPSLLAGVWAGVEACGLVYTRLGWDTRVWAPSQGQGLAGSPHACALRQGRRPPHPPVSAPRPPGAIERLPCLLPLEELQDESRVGEDEGPGDVDLREGGRARGRRRRTGKPEASLRWAATRRNWREATHIGCSVKDVDGCCMCSASELLVRAALCRASLSHQAVADARLHAPPTCLAASAKLKPSFHMR